MKDLSEESPEYVEGGPKWQLAPVSSILDQIALRSELAKQCESPIEIDLAVAVITQIGELLKNRNLRFVPQYRWRQFRMDFAVLRHPDAPVLFIECDGRDYHSSVEQIQNDSRKNAAAERARIPLLRFSGSEIFRWPDGCVHRVLQHLVMADAV